MRVLHIMFEDVRCPTGGLGVFVRDVSAEQAKMGHDVTVLGFDPRTLEHEDFQYRGYRVVLCKNTNIQQNPRGPYHLLALNDMMVENLLYHLGGERYDVVHLHDTLLWPIAKYAAIISRAPIVVSAHLSHALVHSYMPMTRQIQCEITQEIHAYDMSHGVMTCSQAYARDISEYFMLEREWVVATNGVNYGELQGYDRSKGLWGKYSQGKLLVGFVGRMVPSKGVQHVLEAARALPNVAFALISNIAPSIEKYFPLAGEARRLGEESDNFTWVNGLETNDPEKWRLMASCDVGLVPSLHEPWGIVSDEWGSLGVPKIVSRVGGLVEHNSDEDSVMIEPTVEALIGALKTFERDDGMVERARENASRATWADTAQKVVQEYERVTCR